MREMDTESMTEQKEKFEICALEEKQEGKKRLKMNSVLERKQGKREENEKHEAQPWLMNGVFGRKMQKKQLITFFFYLYRC